MAYFDSAPDRFNREQEKQDVLARWEELKIIEQGAELTLAQVREDRAYLRGEAAALNINLD